MRAALTVGPRSIEIDDRPDPPEPPAGRTLLRVEVVGLCASDLHLYRNDLGPSQNARFPVVQGHEMSAVVEAVDPAGSPFEAGERVAVWPVTGCGLCAPCVAGRPNVCTALRIIGVHHDGGLQDLVTVSTANVVGASALSAELAALVEPTSIAIHAVARVRVHDGEHTVIVGGGPIGLASAIAARDRGADVTVVDPVASRRDLAARAGFRVASVDREQLDEMRGEAGPPVVIDTTGRPEVLQTAIDLVAHGGRIGVVGLTGESAPVFPGSLPRKELDVLGASCCVAGEFAAAVDLVRANRTAFDSFVSHTFPLEQLSDAYELIEHDPSAAFKALIDLRVDERAAR